MSLRDRCTEFLAQLQRNGILRQGNPVDDLVAFVETERGRSADSSLADTKPLVLYFGTEYDRQEFIEIVHMAKPGMIAKKMP